MCLLTAYRYLTVGERPADDESTDKETNETKVQDKKVSWADIVAGRATKSAPEERQGTKRFSSGKAHSVGTIQLIVQVILTSSTVIRIDDRLPIA